MAYCKLILILMVLCELCWISYEDIRRRKIRKLSTLWLLVLVCLYRWICWRMEGDEVIFYLAGGLFLAGMVEIVNLAFFQLKGMGGGDIRLLFVMGLFLGLDGGLLALLVGLILALGYGLIKWEEGTSLRIPMGPFLSIGTLAAMFF